MHIIGVRTQIFNLLQISKNGDKTYRKTDKHVLKEKFKGKVFFNILNLYIWVYLRHI